MTTKESTNLSSPQAPAFELPISGMHCASCALSLETALNKLNLGKATVSYTLESAFINTDKESNLANFITEIENLGYKAEAYESKSSERLKLYKLVFCLIVTVPMLFHGWLHLPLFDNGWFQFITVSFVMIIGLKEFGPSALGALRSLAPNMESLVLFGALAAYIYSLIGLLLGLGHQYVFFETAASIITFMLIGSIVEHQAVIKTSSSLKELLNLQPSIAKRLINNVKAFNKTGQQDSDYEKIDARTIQVNDLLLVNTGDKIPADGVVEWGEGSADESMLTGESTAAKKLIGSSVIGGSLLTTGNIRIKATSVGESSVLTQIVNLVKKSQTEKPKIQKIGDKISTVFMPLVLLLSISTFLYWFTISDIHLSFQESFMRALSVLVIACPCAMGLATPLAIAVALGRAAKNGILIKDSSIFEELPRIKNFVFDKTGTLTTGEINLIKINYIGGSQKTTDSIIKTLENHSSHPIAKYLAESFKAAETFELDQVAELSGTGVIAKGHDGINYAIGSEKILSAQSLADFSNQDGIVPNIFVTVEGQIIATLVTGEKIKAGTAEAVNFLKNKNKTIYLVSGDSLKRCLDVAEQIDIPEQNVYAEKLSAEKLAFIKDLIITKRQKTSFIGDGINDSPSLTSSNVGISPGKGSDLAISSAQIVILGEDLSSIAKVYNLSSKTSQTIRQNLFWAFFYNIIAVPFAAFGYLTPTLAALTMTVSDVVIVINSLLLKVKKI